MYKTQVYQFNLLSPKNEKNINPYLPQIINLCLINQKVYNHGIFLTKKHSFYYDKFDLFINKQSKIENLKKEIKQVEYELVELYSLFFLGLFLSKKEIKFFSKKQLSLINKLHQLTHQINENSIF